MSEEAISSTDITEIAPRVSEFTRFRKVFLSRFVVKVGLVIIVTLLIVAFFAPVLAPYDPYKPDLLHTLSPPSRAHPLGTDPLGRDTLSRIIYGARTSLIVGLIVVSLAATIGMALGLLAGYFGGWTHMVVMRFVDTLMSFPMILLARAIHV